MESPRDKFPVPRKVLTARLLGGAAIEEAGRPLSGRAAQRHSLGLLALLSTAPGHTTSREKLVAYLWPEGGPDVVRRRLNVAVYELRKVLGREAIASIGDDLRLDTSAISIDVAMFEEAVRGKRYEEALALYRGPFLDGFYLPDAGDFEAWVQAERDRLARAFARALEARAEEARRHGDLPEVARCWRRLSEQDPYNSRFVLELMRSLAASGERGAALRHADRHARVLAEDLGAVPDPEVEALAERLRRGEEPERRVEHPTVLPVSIETGATVGADEAPAAAEPRTGRLAMVAARRRTIVRVGAVAVAFFLVVGLPWIRAGGNQNDLGSGIDSRRVVILPFRVEGGQGHAYLGEGMAEILGTTLDGAGPLRTVDPRAVLSLTRGEDLDFGDPITGRRVAERFGAGHFVLGTIVGTGRRLAVQATLYRIDGTIEARAAAGASQDMEFFDMVDQLSRDLLAQRYVRREERLTRLALSTSSSLTALKAYLAGESELRAGRYNEAVEAFQRATAEDSTFALAWYRLAVAAEWALQPHEAALAVTRAVEHADRLPERYRLLLQGWRAYARGEVDRAEAIYGRILDIYPEEVEAWLQLGEIAFHYAPSRGRSIAESRTAFERVLALDPEHDGARLHLMRIAALERDRANLDRHVRHLTGRDPASEPALEARVLQAFATGDREDRRRVLAELSRRGSYSVLGAVLSLFYAGSIDGVEASARLLAAPSRPPEVRTAGYSMVALTQLARGRLRDAQASLGTAQSLDPARANELGAMVTVMPFLDGKGAPPDVLRGALAREDAAESFFLPDHDAVRPLLRTYLRALLSARSGDTRNALALATEIERLTSPAADPTLAADLALGVRSEIQRRTGDAASALATLERMAGPTTYELVLPSPFHPRVRERFVRARLLEDLGRLDEAAALYRTMGARSLYDLPYLAPAQARLAALHERKGDARTALLHYERFVEVWGRADPELQPQVTEAREKIASLRR